MSIVERIQLQADIISNINDCVIVADPDLQIILWNRVAEKIFGHREEEVLGKKVKEVFGGLEYKQNPSFCRALDEKREWQGEVVIAASPVRGEKNLRVSISIIRDVAGEIKYMASIITDISELVQSRQEAREASQAKSDFLANMSHELRTPLVGIMGYCELLSQDRLSFHQREYVVTIQHCADQLLNLVNNILDLSKIENKQVEVNPRPFFLPELMRQVINALKPDADKKGLDINLIIAPGIPDIIIADGILIRRILNNLLINAVKFTSQGDIRIKADRKMEIPATGGSEFVLAISVEDSGIGILPEKMEVIFDSFVQGDGSSTRAYGGSGLGLSISKQLVGIMGGSICGENNARGGATFTFTIPVKAGAKSDLS